MDTVFKCSSLLLLVILSGCGIRQFFFRQQYLNKPQYALPEDMFATSIGLVLNDAAFEDDFDGRKCFLAAMLGPHNRIVGENIQSWLNQTSGEFLSQSKLIKVKENIDTIIVHIHVHGCREGKFMCKGKNCTRESEYFEKDKVHPIKIFAKLREIFGSERPILIISESCYGFLVKQTLDENRDIYGNIALISSGEHLIKTFFISGIIQGIIFNTLINDEESNGQITISKFLELFEQIAKQKRQQIQNQNQNTSKNLDTICTYAYNKSIPDGYIYHAGSNTAYLSECSVKGQINLLKNSAGVGDITMMQNIISQNETILREDNVSDSLINTILSGYNDAMKLLVNKGADVNHVHSEDKMNGFTRTPLCFAIGFENLDAIQLLVNNGADVNPICSNEKMSGVTPLYLATSLGDATKRLDVVKRLLDKNADVNLCGPNEVTPLYIASQEGHAVVVKLLLAADEVDNNKADKNGATPLYVASQEGRAEVVKRLLAADADVKKTTKEGFTPLFVASMVGHKEVVILLITAAADVNQADNDEVTPLFIASMKGHAVVVKLLLAADEVDNNKADKNGVTPLYVASQEGHAGVVELLIDAGANANHANKYGYTPLYVASMKGHVEVVELLVGAKAKVNEADIDGYTPLYVASQNGQVGVVEVLIGANADVNQANQNGATPLLMASQQGHAKVVKVLLDKDDEIKVDKGNKRGISPLWIASQNGHPGVVAQLIDAGANVNHANKYGYTPLFVASYKGHLEVVAKLLTSGADANLATSNGDTPLSIASQKGRVGILGQLINFNANPTDAQRLYYDMMRVLQLMHSLKIIPADTTITHQGEGEIDSDWYVRVKIEAKAIFDKHNGRGFASDYTSNLGMLSINQHHTVALLKDGTVYTWGVGEYGRLGHGNTNNQPYPKIVAGLQVQEVKQISASDKHSVALLNDGTVMTWGEGMFGKLGHGDENDQHIPKIVEELQNKKVLEVSTRSYRTVALVESGNVYTWGGGGNAQLGHGRVAVGNQLKPKLVEALKDKKVTQISVGVSHNIALLENGDVYVWGNGRKYGYIDNDHHPSWDQLSTPKIVQELKGRKVKYVAAASEHSVVLLNNGDVYTWGRVWNGQLGHPFATGDSEGRKHVPLPTIFQSLSGQVLQMSSAYNHSVALLKDGTVLTWGSGFYGQLGYSTQETWNVPKIVEGLQHGEVVKVKATVHGTTIYGNSNHVIAYFGAHFDR